MRSTADVDIAEFWESGANEFYLNVNGGGHLSATGFYKTKPWAGFYYVGGVVAANCPGYGA